MTDFRDAACVNEDPRLFFPAERELPNSRYARLRVSTALRICAECPLRVDCLTDALMRDEQVGIRGGLNLEGDEYATMRTAYRADIDRRQREADERRAEELAATPGRLPCGSERAAQAHLRRGEHLDEACRQARNVVHKERARRRSERRAEEDNREGKAA